MKIRILYISILCFVFISGIKAQNKNGEIHMTESFDYPYIFITSVEVIGNKLIKEAVILRELDINFSDSIAVFKEDDLNKSGVRRFIKEDSSELILRMDYSRGNQINAYEGIYANINYRINPTFLGSDQNSTALWLEFRTYVGLSEKFPRHLIAFWAFGDFNLTGKMPYLTLPSLGEDQRARSGRGYTNGRFKGWDIVYTEVEYRFPISQCTQILGGVLFENATTIHNPHTGVNLFEYVRPAVGCGIRIMVNKHFRTSINIDFAIGVESKGFYFSGQETF